MQYALGTRLKYTIGDEERYGRVTARDLSQEPNQYTVRRTVSGAANSANLVIGNDLAYDTIRVNQIIPYSPGNNDNIGHAMNVISENHGMNTNNNGYNGYSSNSSNGNLRRRRNTRRRRSTRRRRNTRRRA